MIIFYLNVLNNEINEGHRVGKRWSCDFKPSKTIIWVYLVAQTVKNLPAMTGTQVQSLGLEDPLEKEMATHSSTLA